jgi:hypothetical protein
VGLRVRGASAADCATTASTVTIVTIVTFATFATFAARRPTDEFAGADRAHRADGDLGSV